MPEEHIKVRRKRGPNRDKRPLGRGDTPSRAFAPGTPIDPKTQLPPGEEVEIDRATAARIPLDPESARVAAEHHETMSRKARGESGVKWNADPRIRYAECAMLHPNARVSFKNLASDADNLPSTNIAAVRDYDALIRYIEQNFWRGDRVSYKWTIGDDTQPQWATGVIKFDAKDQDMGQGQQPPPGYGPQWPAPPPPPQAGPQWNVPGWFNGVYWDGRAWAQPQQQQVAPPPPPPPTYQQPPPQAAPAAPPPAQAAPPPPPPPQMAPVPMMGGAPDAQTQYLFDEIRRLHAVIDQRNQQPSVVAAPPPAPPPPPQQAGPQWGVPGVFNGHYWNGSAYGPLPTQQPAAAAPAQAPVAPVAQPMTPIESAKSAMQTVLELADMNKRLKAEISDPTPPVDDLLPDEAEKPPEDPFPMSVKDLGPFRMASIKEGDGPAKMVEGMMPFVALNIDKIGAGVEGMLGKIGQFMDQRIKQSTQVNDQQAQAQRRSVENAERLAAAQKTMAEAEAQSAQAQALKAAALQAQRQLEAADPPPPPPAPAPAPAAVAAPPPPPPPAPAAVAAPPPPKPTNGNGFSESTRREVDSFVDRVIPPKPPVEAAPPQAAPPAPPAPEVENFEQSQEPKVPVLSEN